MCRPVARTEIPRDNEQSCCHAVGKVLIPGHSFAVRGNISSISRSFEASIRGRYRRRKTKDNSQRKSSWGKSQVTKSNTPDSSDTHLKRRCDLSTFTCPADNQDGDHDLSVKNVLTAPDPKRKKYVHESIGPLTEAFQVKELEKQLRCLTVTTEDKPMRAVSPRIEEAYAQGDPLTPPEIEFSEDSDMEDDYWTWDRDTQHFKHWDEELGEWVNFPERFD